MFPPYKPARAAQLIPDYAGNRSVAARYWCLLVGCLLTFCFGGNAGASALEKNVSFNRATASHDAQLGKLCEKLKSPRAQDRVEALKQLGSLRSCGRGAVAAILACLSANGSLGGSAELSANPAPAVTDAAIAALSAIGPSARQASPQLVSMLADRNQLFRRTQILNALDRIGVDNTAAPTIMEVVSQEGKHTEARLAAIKLLGKADPPATTAIDLLQEIAEDKSDVADRQAALQACRSIIERSRLDGGQAQETQHQLSDLKAAIAPTQPTATRLDALSKIAKLGERAAPLCQALLPMLNDADKDIQSGTVNAFCSIGPQAAGALSALIGRLLNTQDESMRNDLSRAIIVLDPSEKLIISFIGPALNDPFKARAALCLLDQLSTPESAELAEQTRRRWCIK